MRRTEGGLDSNAPGKISSPMDIQQVHMRHVRFFKGKYEKIEKIGTVKIRYNFTRDLIKTVGAVFYV